MTKKNILKSVGKGLEKRMKEKFASNVAFAKHGGLNEKTVRSVLAGKNVSLKVLNVMCNVLALKVSTLLKQAGH